MKFLESPAGRQWQRFKERHPDCLLLFRLGDFYESFGPDAETVARLCGLTLTSRGGLAMAGFPFHSLEVRLRVLIQQGQRVAVCETIGEARKPDRADDRAVTRVVTPAAEPVQPCLFP